MRILVISPYLLSPLTHGGRVRTVGISRGLAAAGARVTVLSPWHPRERPAAVLGEEIDHRVHLLPASALLWALPRRVASPQAILSLNPQLPVRRLLARLGRFDAYQFEFCAFARWAEAVPARALTVYSAHNVERDYFAAERHHYLLRSASARRIERQEHRAVTSSDLVVTCTEQDAGRLRDLHGPHRSLVLPNAPSPALGGAGHPVREHARAELGIAEGELAALFLGGGGVHNLEAAAFLARDVLPRLSPDVRLILAGECAAGAGEPSDPRLLRVGPVADPRTVLAAADVGLNPALSATGSSVKVADYLAAGLPVLATPQGARGDGGAGRVRTASRERFAEALAESSPPVLPPPARPGWEERGARLLEELAALRRAGTT